MLHFSYKFVELTEDQAIGFLLYDAREKDYPSTDIYKAIRAAHSKKLFNEEDPIEWLQGITHGLEITHGE